ncbi:MAG: hypothetical protein AAF614_34305 [Chloroflexota bacterium]
MNMTENKMTSSIKGAERVFLIALIIWILLQMVRFVAIPLIQSIVAGIDAPGWMYPAMLDVVTAVIAPFLAIALWKWRGFAVWTFTVVYLVVSIVDHGGAFISLALIGEPAAFEALNPSGSSPWVAPIIQTALDFVFLYLILLPKNRRLFFELSS